MTSCRISFLGSRDRSAHIWIYSFPLVPSPWNYPPLCIKRSKELMSQTMYYSLYDNLSMGPGWRIFSFHLTDRCFKHFRIHMYLRASNCILFCVDSEKFILCAHDLLRCRWRSLAPLEILKGSSRRSLRGIHGPVSRNYREICTILPVLLWLHLNNIVVPDHGSKYLENLNLGQVLSDTCSNAARKLAKSQKNKLAIFPHQGERGE